MSNINVPFGPRIPDYHVVPRMGPGHNKQAQGIVIKYVHSIILHPGLDASAGGGPLRQLVASIGVSDYDCEKRLFASITG